MNKEIWLEEGRRMRMRMRRINPSVAATVDHIRTLA